MDSIISQTEINKFDELMRLNVITEAQLKELDLEILHAKFANQIEWPKVQIFNKEPKIYEVFFKELISSLKCLPSLSFSATDFVVTVREVAEVLRMEEFENLSSKELITAITVHNNFDIKKRYWILNKVFSSKADSTSKRHEWSWERI